MEACDPTDSARVAEVIRLRAAERWGEVAEWLRTRFDDAVTALI